MKHPLSQLVHFAGEETALVSRVKKSVEWVASKPEGRALLEEARALHRKPLKIITDSRVHNIGYGNHLGEHVIYANPNVTDKLQFHGNNGEVIQGSLERFFPHEFKHATQSNVIANAQDYLVRKQQIMEESLPPVPYEKYLHRIKTAIHDDKALKRILGEMYDAHVAPHASRGLETALTKSDHDPVIQKFVRKYETPAIETENLIMQKYRGEPARTTNYAKSGVHEEYIKSMDRDGFIETALESIRMKIKEQRATVGSQAVRGGKRTEPKPRKGNWSENT